MQFLITNIEEINSYTLARSVSMLDTVKVNWIVLAVKQIKVDTLHKCFLKAGFGEDDCSDTMNEGSENVWAIINLCQCIKLLPCDTNKLIIIYHCLATH